MNVGRNFGPAKNGSKEIELVPFGSRDRPGSYVGGGGGGGGLGVANTHLAQFIIFCSLACQSGQSCTLIHSKNTRVSVTGKRVHWSQTPFRVNNDPEISQLDAKYDPELGQSDPIMCQFDWNSGSSLTRNGVWPQWTLFRVTADPGVFRVYPYPVYGKLTQLKKKKKRDRCHFQGWRSITACNEL